MITNWINVTIEDLYTYLAAPQVEALRRCAVAKSQPDPVADAIQNVVLSIRAYIVSNKRNVLSQSPYAIPPELKSDACVLILEVAQLRIPGFRLTSDQVRLVEDARGKMQKIVSGEFVVSLPNDRAMEPEKAMEVVASRRRVITGKTLEGF
ncbi:MAG: hypothetical protein LW808_003205 [Verrucomicrobiota bacterium]|nr:MAG: hypothetical protein LW808_003205 [Verrucomicrobiota bacterium]